MKTNIIYGLADSRNDLIYYVGKSTVGSTRAVSHLSCSHSPQVNEWISSVESDWGHINVILVEEVEDLHLLAEREKYWIVFYSLINDELLNKRLLPDLSDPYTEKDSTEFSQFKNAIYFAGEAIKRRRSVLGMTQNALAAACGISRSTLSLAEREGCVSLCVLKKILLVLTGLSITKETRATNIKKRVRTKK